MFIDVAFVRMMQMPVVQIVDVAIVHDASMATLGPMRMIVQDQLQHSRRL
jgi:hypothetical protein